ncbi:DNA polymerase III subunit delta' [Thioclava sp. SK-1]|uniref:DNA polymerase III subunit delta' n=1 Tax=Thioclava sp. SK-1 TaxID=1889770 RepID=UPI0008260BCC|nr:DNA polymerase III subunit delta' [Thioclava sp. SK-1]OCX61423.1 DNA polymerase III subunit delta' [Thioclava sp. SK-1]
MRAPKKSADPLPDPCQIDGAPHPRETTTLFGHDAAQAQFLDAFTTGRLHHGWMLVGPRGIGKATLAWRIAKFLLSQPDDDGGMFAPPPPTDLSSDPDHPAVRRILAGSEAGVFELKRGANTTGTGLSRDIRVDEVRKLKSFLHLSATEGGRRVVIIDCADEMNPQAANALLKLLEEPPERVTFLLIAHQPAALLPTIRSRCRELRLTTVQPEDMALALQAADALDPDADTMALAALSSGSVGEAIRLTQMDGLAAYSALIDLMSTLPRLDRPRAIALTDGLAGKKNEPRFDLLLDLLDLFLARTARAGLSGPPQPEAAKNESQLLARLSPDGHWAMVWARLHQESGARARHGRAVNLDPAALVLDMILRITSAVA